jgi:hypothetical protein
MPDWLTRLLPSDWFAGWTTTDYLWFGAGSFVVTFFGSILAVGWVLTRLPADFFAGDECRSIGRARHPVLRAVLFVLKNFVGVVLLLLGIIMSLPGVPGQGLLTILIGSLLLDYPGKRSAERWLLGRRGVLDAVNKLRRRFGREPMFLDCPVPLAVAGGAGTTSANHAPDTNREPSPCQPASAAEPTFSATTSTPTRSSPPST